MGVVGAVPKGVVMQIGVSLPNFGASANPEAILRGAQHAEALGYDARPAAGWRWPIAADLADRAATPLS